VVLNLNSVQEETQRCVAYNTRLTFGSDVRCASIMHVSLLFRLDTKHMAESQQFPLETKHKAESPIFIKKTEHKADHTKDIISYK
jgi:hypothetical protein